MSVGEENANVIQMHVILERLQKMDEKFNFLQEQLRYIDLKSSENLFATRLELASRYSPWFKVCNFSGYHAAADYALLFALFRVLDRFKPKSILEFGAGDTSKLIKQYLEYHEEAKGITIEHNPFWIDILKSDGVWSRPNHQCHQLHVNQMDFQGELINAYVGINDLFARLNCKYDLVIIDGGDSSDRYSRLSSLACFSYLTSDAVVIIDDLDRKGELEMLDVFFQMAQTHQKSFTLSNVDIHRTATSKYPCAKQVVLMGPDRQGTWT